MNLALLACLLLAAPGPAPASSAPASPAPASPAPAAGSCTSPAALAAWAADTSMPVGAWSDYASLVDGKVVPDEAMRVFIVDTGSPDKPQRWFEVDRKDGKVAFRIPMDGQGGGAPVIKQGRLFFEVQPEDVEAGGGSCRATGKEPTTPVTLTTPAGRFQTRYFKKEYGPLTVEYWVAQGVHPLGLVQLKITPSEHGKGMVLVDRGANAVSAFPSRFRLAKFPTAESIRALLPLDPVRDVADAGTPPGPDAGAAAAPVAK